MKVPRPLEAVELVFAALLLVGVTVVVWGVVVLALVTLSMWTFRGFHHSRFLTLPLRLNHDGSESIDVEGVERLVRRSSVQTSGMLKKRTFQPKHISCCCCLFHYVRRTNDYWDEVPRSPRAFLFRCLTNWSGTNFVHRAKKIK